MVVFPGLSKKTKSGRAKQFAEMQSQGSRAGREEVEELLLQVGRDLEPWRESGITLQMVEKNYCTEAIDWSMRIQVDAISTLLFGGQLCELWGMMHNQSCYLLA